MHKLFKKLWFFLWEDESVWSWLVNVALAFVVIKFLLYPALGFLLGTPAPIVAVVSGSMEHDSDFEQFWSKPSCCSVFCTKQIVQGEFYEEINISRAMFRNFDFVNGFNKGDIMILYSPAKVEPGEVIVYLSEQRPEPIIHRVIKTAEENNKKFFWTKGDHNCDIGSFELKVSEERVIGKAVWRVPFLGWVKIAAVSLLGLVK